MNPTKSGNFDRCAGHDTQPVRMSAVQRPPTGSVPCPARPLVGSLSGGNGGRR